MRARACAVCCVLCACECVCTPTAITTLLPPSHDRTIRPHLIVRHRQGMLRWQSCYKVCPPAFVDAPLSAHERYLVANPTLISCSLRADPTLISIAWTPLRSTTTSIAAGAVTRSQRRTQQEGATTAATAVTHGTGRQREKLRAALCHARANSVI